MGAMERGVRLVIGSLALGLGTLSGSALLAQGTCAVTPPDMEGPFYQAGAPDRAATGHGLVVAGLVRSAQGCAGIAGARLEWWSANRDGRYDDAHRAAQTADASGRFRYETDPPGRYPGRPPHLHVRVTAPGHRALVTQLYPKPGQAALDIDFVLTRD